MNLRNINFCLILVLLTFIGIDYIDNDSYYIQEREQSSIQEENAETFLETFSLGNRLSADYLNLVAEFNVVNKFSSLMGDSQRGMQYPIIYGSWWNDDYTEYTISFDPNIHEMVELYRYTFKFNNATNRICDVDTEYYYRGELDKGGK